MANQFSFKENVLVLRSASPYSLALQTALLGVLWWAVPISTVMAQEPVGKAPEVKLPAPGKEELSPAPAKVDVKPVARDEEIRKRLQSVLDATGWFTEPKGTKNSLPYPRKRKLGYPAKPASSRNRPGRHDR